MRSETPVEAETQAEGHLKHNRVVPMDKLRPHPDNYRMHPEDQVNNLVASLERFGQGRSIVVQDGPQGYLIVAGHGIYQAAKRLRYKELRADILPADWSPEQVKGYLIADNQHVAQAEDDQEILLRLLQEQQSAGYNLATLGTDEDSLNQMLADMGDAILRGGEDEEDGQDAENREEEPPRQSLADRFIVPPFSVLDARQGYWQDRKRAWISLGIQSELGRGEFALEALEADGEYHSETGGLTYGDSPEITESGLNYYRRREKEIRREGLLGIPEKVRRHYKRSESVLQNRSESITNRTGPYAKNGRGLARTFGQDLMRGEHVVGSSEKADDKAAHVEGLLGKHFPTIHAYDEGGAGGTVSQSGTSIFDPVLCELVYRWFTPQGGLVLDPFSGGSVRGIVAAKLGRNYIGIDLRPEQVAANQEQWPQVAGKALFPQEVEEEPDWIVDVTPVQEHGGYLVKRDDLFCIAGVRGGKVRTCWRLASGARGLVTAGSRQSPQVNIVAHIAQRLGIPCHVHTPTGELSDEVRAARDCGAEVIQHTAGYNSVIIARAREDAEEQGWTNIPFGMECEEAVDETASQVANLPFDRIKRIVMPVGSGMSLAGVLYGLREAKKGIQIIGVRVGADPTKRLDQYAPPNWRDFVTLVDPGIDYHKPASTTRLGDLTLDPIYEAKCLPYLQEGDLLWVVGVRQTLVVKKRPAATRGKLTWTISAKWASKSLNCTVEGIINACHGKCCYGPSFWPGRSGGRADNACAHLGPQGCTLSLEDKPVTCHLFPLKLNSSQKWVGWQRIAQTGSCCHPNYGHGPMIIEALYDSLVSLFGRETADYIKREVQAGRDPSFTVPDAVSAALEREERWATDNTIPLLRSTFHDPSVDLIQSTSRNYQPKTAPTWIVGDSRNLETLCPEVEADLVFTCPPYYDLEVYSDNPADLSMAGSYTEFMAEYRVILRTAIARLKQDRFACVVVGDIRDKHGFYRNFVSDTIAACEEAGVRLYNEAILLTVAGSLPIRAGRQFSLARKLGKTHQNVLVFCKGDPKKATEACGPVTVEVPEEEEDEFLETLDLQEEDDA